MGKNLTNYHSHCSFCDGRAEMEDFVRSAVAAGFSAYGISSHAPLPFHTAWNMDGEKMPDYLQEAERLKGLYADEIELYVGLEIDYLNGERHPAIPYFQELPLDYRIGSVHLVYTDEGEIVDTDTSAENFRRLVDRCFHGDLKSLAVRYYSASMRMLAEGGFDFIAHADKISHNVEICCPGTTSEKWYRDLWNALLEEVAGQGLIMEVNTKAFQQKGCFFPGQGHFREMFDRGVKVVVNSDAHYPERINAGRQEALGALVEAGYTAVMELHGGEWQEVEIVGRTMESEI